jgi:branched-chain amino acid transport system substrate-binding protein
MKTKRDLSKSIAQEEDMKTEHCIKTIGITLVLLAFMVGAALPAWAEKKPYKVGCNFSLTGGFAMFTGIIKKGLILEQERINAQGGIDGHPLELIFEDSGQDITKMANINRKFARDKEIKAIVGPLWSVSAPTLIPIAERENIPEIAIWAPSAVERQLKPHWVFNIPQGDVILAERTIDLAMARGYKKVFAFSDQDPIWSPSMVKEVMRPIGQKHGIEVFVTEETYHQADTDMTPQILKFKDQLKDYNALFLGTNGGTGSIIMRNLLAQGIRIPILGTHAWGFGFTLEMGKEAVEGVEFVSGKAVVTDQLDDSDPQTAVTGEVSL